MGRRAPPTSRSEPMFRDNPLKARLAEGGRALGCWLNLASPMAAEIVALAGYDFVLIDHEHGPGSLRDGVALMQAVSATAAASVMRVPWNDAVYIKRALDAGAEGIMVPAVEDAAAARAAVAACRYPPAGVRGVAYTITRASDYGLRTEDYGARANANLVILCQIESLRAIENVAEIAATAGLDVLFIGPFDLSAALGKPGRFEDAEVADAIARAEAAILESGKVLGGIPREGDPPAAMFARGYRLIASGSDVVLLREGARADIAAAKTEG